VHEIQSHVLRKLSLARRARYSDLRPKGVDGNLFVYHLGALKKAGLLVAKDDGYALTPAGKRVVDRMSFETLGERIQPKIVTLIVAERGGEQLLWRRSRAPLLGHVGFPYGKVHLEERVKEAAERELREKAGLSAKLRHRGDMYLTIHDETELVTQMLWHVFSATAVTGEIRQDFPGGACFWGKLDEVPRDELLPGAKQALKLCRERKDHFFEEYFLNAKDD
jgi:ADP-ribose pyrophosphatase YjhB (NUDIX family)